MQLTDSQSELAKWLAERQASGALPDTFTVDWKLENYNPHHGTIKGIEGDQPEIGFATLVALEEAGLVKTVSKVVVPGKKSGATKTGLYQYGWPRHETSRTYTILGPLASFSSPVAQSPSAPERASQQHRHKADFISQDLIDKLGALQTTTYDLSRLVQYCKEINDNFRMQNFSAVAFLSRAILDHCPPIFGQPNFESVIAHATASSLRDIARRLDQSLKKIADHHIHKQIGKTESLPTEQEIGFSSDLNFLLGRIVERI